MADNYFGANNPFMDFLELEPTAAYYSSPGGKQFASGNQGQQRYF